jgi:predicted outer membrane protein
MDRRTVTVGLMAAIASPALAQQTMTAPVAGQQPRATETQQNQNLQASPAQQQRMQSGGNPQDTGAQAAAQGGARQSQSDAQHIEQTLAIGTLAHQAATFARDKAQHPRVKQFAMFEEAEQTTIAEVIKSLADPATTSSTGTQSAASTAPAMSQDASAKMEKMSKAQGGPEFDKEFVALQLEGHQNLLQVQERYISSNPPNRAQLAIAKLARGQIKEHIALLQDMQKELR